MRFRLLHRPAASMPLAIAVAIVSFAIFAANGIVAVNAAEKPAARPTTTNVTTSTTTAATSVKTVPPTPSTVPSSALGAQTATATPSTAPKPTIPCAAKRVLTAREEQWQGTGVRRAQHRYAVPGKNGFFFTSGMTIDADGSPRAFHPVTDQGLDDLVNAGHPGNWWGIMTTNGETWGKPIVQGPNDPAPGFYISQTGLEDTTKRETDPRRYVDAELVPYVVLSGTSRQNLRATFGDYIVVYNKLNRKVAYAMYGDNWPILKIGEGSIALATQLDIDANPRTGGVEDPTVTYLVFPRSRTTPWSSTEPISATAQAAQKLFTEWGGLQQLEACVLP